MLVSAFSGTAAIKKAYQEAIEQQYRFFSYGDAMFLNKQQRDEAWANDSVLWISPSRPPMLKHALAI